MKKILRPSMKQINALQVEGFQGKVVYCTFEDDNQVHKYIKLHDPTNINSSVWYKDVPATGNLILAPAKYKHMLDLAVMNSEKPSDRWQDVLARSGQGAFAKEEVDLLDPNLTDWQGASA